MPEKISLNNKTYLSSLSESEKSEIEEKVKFELEFINYDTLTKMTKIGGLANILGGLFVVWVLFHQIKPQILLNWYLILIIFNLINIVWSGYFQNHYSEVNHTILRRWHYGLYVILATLTLTWGSIGILFTPENPAYQLYVITFLQVVVLSYGFAATIDFKLALVSVGCLLLPTIIYRIYEATLYSTMGFDFVLNVAFAVSLFILGGFLLIVCYIGYMLTKSQTTLSMLNAVLNQKLENVNKFLEERVKERTIELEKSLKLVTYQATHDLLTDLPNHRLLLEYMNAAIVAAKEDKHMFAIIFFSINEIEKINDGLGHHIGDMVIKTIAQRFQKKFIDEDNEAKQIRYKVTLSRKDVFVVLIEPIYNLDEVEKIAQPLFKIVDEPIFSENQVIRVTASIGISVYPRNGEDIKTLLMNADAAMLRAQQYGGNSLNMYKAEINADISKQLELESNLHAALQNSEFTLYYQPFVNLAKGEICGLEALVRWENPTLGLISPDSFIPLAEANGIIIPLGEWVLRTACKQTKIWHQLGFNNLKVAINLSAKQLQQKNIIVIIDEIIKEVGLDPSFIELELTETAAFKEEVIPVIRQFTAMGIGLSIDDFGTGYSGLSNLKVFDIDKLKIDKSFIRDIDTNMDDRTIVSNIIDIAKKMDISILAEGVETKEQLKLLKELHCDMIQGYYFSPPVNADIFTELLISRKHFDI